MEGAPAGWSSRNSVVMAVGRETGHSLRTDLESGFAMISQDIDADVVRELGIQVSGYIRSESLEGDASLVIQLYDADDERIFFEDMRGWAADGTTAWTRYRYVVPPFAQAARAEFSLFAVGNGSVWFDDVSVTPLHRRKGGASEAALAYLEDALDQIQERAINADSLDWPAIRQRLIDRAAYAATPADTYPIIREALQLVDARHTSFVPAHARQAASSAKSAVLSPEVARADGIGMIVLPPAPRGSEERAYIETGRHGIADAAADVRCGWVVDLRKTGGNQWAMLGALLDFFADGMIGGMRRGDEFVEYHKRGAAIVNVDHEGAESERVGLDSVERLDAPIAVLIGRGTASAGEATALTLRGRPETRFFGTPSAGLSTANAPVELSDGSIMVVTTGNMIDRHGRGDGSPIEPDVSTDSPYEAAVDWLKAQCPPPR